MMSFQVEHIVREDYLVEAMEVIELYCDLLLARFGMLEQMSYVLIYPPPPSPSLMYDCMIILTVSITIKLDIVKRVLLRQ